MRSVEDLIATGDICLVGRFTDASNATLYGEISAPGCPPLHVVYKPIAGERPLWDFPSGSLAFRERAAYLIDAWSGLNRVPFTVLRDGPLGIGSVQLWLEVNEEIDIIEIGQSTHAGIRSIAFLDLIINNADRKFGHLLPVSESEIFACDHGVSFHIENKLRTVLWQFAGKEFLDSELEILSILLSHLKSDGAAEIHSLLSPAEVEALLRRIMILIDTKIFPFPEPHRPAVPWPPV